MAKTKEETSPDLSAYLEKEPTDLQARFAEWLKDEEIVGYDPSKAKNKEEAFNEGVRLAVALRMTFQASPENREANASRKTSKGEDEAPKGKKARASDEDEAPKKSKKQKAAVEADEDEAAPKKKSKKDDGKKSGGKAKGSGKKSKAAADDEDEAPF